MSIFRYVIRVLDVALTLCHLLNPSHARILVRAHVHNIVVALILNGTAGVESLDGLVSLCKIVARASLVAQAPYHYRWSVDMRAYHFHIAGHMGITPLYGT